MTCPSRVQPSPRFGLRLLAAAATLVASVWLIRWVARREGVTLDWRDMPFGALAAAVGVMVLAWAIDALRVRWLAAGVGGRIGFGAALRTVLAATIAYGVALGALVWTLPRLDVARRAVAAVFRAAGAVVGPVRAARWEARTLAFVDRLAGAFALLFRRRPDRLAVAIVLYALFFLAVFSVAPILAAGLGLEVLPLALVAVQVPFFLLLTLAPTPGGKGAAEIGLFALFEHLVPAAGLGLLVAGVRAVTFYLGLAAGAVSLTLMTLQKAGPDGVPGAG